MKKLWLLGVAAACLAVIPQVNAATPNLSGTYIVTLNGVCQSIWIQDVPGGNVHFQTGDFQQSIGRFVFKPTFAGAQKGKFTGTLTSVTGWINNSTTSDTYLYPPDSRFAKATESFGGTYTMTGSSLTLKTVAETQVFNAIYGTTNNAGTADEVNLLRFMPGTPAGSEPETPDCSQNITAQRR